MSWHPLLEYCFDIFPGHLAVQSTLGHHVLVEVIIEIFVAQLVIINGTEFTVFIDAAAVFIEAVFIKITAVGFIINRLLARRVVGYKVAESSHLDYFYLN